MKKVIGLVLSLITVLQAAVCLSTNVTAATTHRHTYTTIIEGIGNNSKHQKTRKCTSCGYVSSVSQQIHQKGTIISYSQLDTSKHTITYRCKTQGCGETFTSTGNHSWKTLNPQDKNTTHHEIIKQCKYCNATKSDLKSHSYSSSGFCKCGRMKPEGRPATNKKGKGMCTLIGRPLGVGDLWVYPKCPNCQSSSCTWVRDEKIGGLPKSFNSGTVVKHQHVRCNNCGKEYTNKCFTVVE